MPYITDAMREYAKKHADDEKDACTDEAEDVVESFINMIDAFDKLHHDEFVELFRQYDVDEFTGPTMGSKLLEEYAKIIKGE